MEIFSYLWLSVLIAFLLAATVSLPDNYKIGRLEFNKRPIHLICFIIALVFYWSALSYHFHYIVIIAVSTIIIYLCIDIKLVTDRSKKIFGHIRDNEIGKARKSLHELVQSVSSVNIHTGDMDEEAIIANTVEYTARALVPSAVAPLFYSIIIGPLGAVLYRYVDDISDRDIKIMTILNYIPARLGFITFWIATSTVTKNRAYMMKIVKRDMPNSKNKTDDLIVAGFAGTTWMRLGGNKEYYDIYDEDNNTIFAVEEASFGDMREPPHLSDILRATKLFNLTVIIFIVLALCIREYEFIWYFLKKFVI